MVMLNLPLQSLVPHKSIKRGHEIDFFMFLEVHLMLIKFFSHTHKTNLYVKKTWLFLTFMLT